MPGGDKTGPNSQGPMTGRRLGLCSGYEFPENVQYGKGYRGCGNGFGRGSRGRGGYGRSGYGRGNWNNFSSYPRPHPIIMPVDREERNPEIVIKDLEYHKSRLEYELQMIDKAITNQKESKSAE